MKVNSHCSLEYRACVVHSDLLDADLQRIHALLSRAHSLNKTVLQICASYSSLSVRRIDQKVDNVGYSPLPFTVSVGLPLQFSIFRKVAQKSIFLL